MTDPVISHSTTRVRTASSGSATGRVRATAARASARLAAWPPTATGNGAGCARTLATRAWAAAEAGAPRTPTLISQVPWPRSAGGVTPSTPLMPRRSLAKAPTAGAALAGAVTAMVSGLVPAPGKSRAIVSETTRELWLEGSTPASMPVQ